LQVKGHPWKEEEPDSLTLLFPSITNDNATAFILNPNKIQEAPW
jgi:hypothetical protein